MADEVEEPTVIFEVTSPDTERIDRGDKLVNYFGLPSMRVYVLVDQYKAAVTIYRREVGGEWGEIEVVGSLEGTGNLPEVECALSMHAIYDRVIPIVIASGEIIRTCGGRCRRIFFH